VNRNRLLVLGALVVVLVVIYSRRTVPGTVHPRGYHNVGDRMNYGKSQSGLSPDPLPQVAQHLEHFLANAMDIGENVITGPHPLYAHPDSCSPNLERIRREGWSWMLDPPSEVSL
jgi:hypothetical protein